MEEKEFPPLTWKQRGAVAGGILAALGAMAGLDAIGERLPNCPTEPPSAAIAYPLIYPFLTPMGPYLFAAMLMLWARTWLLSERHSGARKLAAIGFGGVVALGATVLLSALFPAGPAPSGVAY